LDIPAVYRNTPGYGNERKQYNYLKNVFSDALQETSIFVGVQCVLVYFTLTVMNLQKPG
jgi:hypothetical protein